MLASLHASFIPKLSLSLVPGMRLIQASSFSSLATSMVKHTASDGKLGEDLETRPSTVLQATGSWEKAWERGLRPYCKQREAGRRPGNEAFGCTASDGKLGEALGMRQCIYCNKVYVLCSASFPGFPVSEHEYVYAGRAWYLFSCGHDVVEKGPVFLEQKINVLYLTLPYCSLIPGHSSHLGTRLALP